MNLGFQRPPFIDAHSGDYLWGVPLHDDDDDEILSSPVV